MIRVHTGAITALVIKLKPARNRPNQQLVNNDVSVSGSAFRLGDRVVDRVESVAVTTSAIPQPAATHGLRRNKARKLEKLAFEHFIGFRHLLFSPRALWRALRR